MKALIQRVSHAEVDVAGETIGKIDQGILLLLGVEKNDGREQADKLVHKVAHYRIFADDNGKMNCSVKDIDGAILVVSQFTLAAETAKGLRPGFSTAALPQEAEMLYQYFIEQLKKTAITVATGSFAADMQVSLTNDGPVTFLLQS